MGRGLRRASRLAAGLSVALFVYGDSVAQAPPAREAPRKGAIVSHEERASSSIVYFEESGGMAKVPTPAGERDASSTKATRSAKPTPAAPPVVAVVQSGDAGTPPKKRAPAAVAARQ